MVAIRHLFNRIELDNEIKQIAENIEKYNLYFKDVCSSPIGKYSINNILKIVEEALNYLEIFAPVIKKWVQDYLVVHRGKLWLYYGIEKGNEQSDYWNIRETNFSELMCLWPFLFNRDDSQYKDFIIDLKAAQNEVLRQRKRQSTSNPKYKPFHPDGCSSGCSCWMLDDMDQWYTEEQEEIKASRNIFFNGALQRDFYKVALDELEGLKEQWEHWTPLSIISSKSTTEFTIQSGLTPIKIILSWIKNDFNHSQIFSMFSWSDIFINVWENIDSAGEFINCEREKLKKIVDLI